MEALEAEKELDLLMCVVSYLKDGVYPQFATLNQKRVIRKKAKKFVFRDGVLYYINVKRGRGSAKVMQLKYPAYMAFTLLDFIALAFRLLR